MKTSSIKNTITGMMLFLGVAIQVISPALPNNENEQLQACNQKFIAKLEHQISKIKLPFGIKQLNSNTRIKKGE